MSDHLIAPHGGGLVDLFASDARGAELKAESRDWPSHDLTPRQLCDLELLVSGGFSPLTGFLGRSDHERVCAEMRLGDGTLWPVPIRSTSRRRWRPLCRPDPPWRCATRRA